VSQSAIKQMMYFLAEFSLEGVVLGTCRDREFGVEFSAIGRRFVLLFEFPELPCIFVYPEGRDCRIDQECLNTKSTPALEEASRIYYALIETIPYSRLESYRCTDWFDKWCLPVVEEYIRIIRSQLSESR
jgi:hypothetical protein